MAASSRSSRSQHCNQRSSATRHKETSKRSDGGKRRNVMEETNRKHTIDPRSNHADTILVESHRDRNSISSSQQSYKPANTHPSPELLQAPSTQVDSSYEHISATQDNSDDGWSYTSNSTNDDFISSGQLGGYRTLESDISCVGHWALSPDGTWYQGAGDNQDPISGYGVEPVRVKSHVEEAVVSFEKLFLGP